MSMTMRRAATINFKFGLFSLKFSDISKPQYDRLLPNEHIKPCSIVTCERENLIMPTYLRECFPSAENVLDLVASYLLCACAKSVIPCERDARC